MASGCLGCAGLLQADTGCLCAQPKYGRFRGLDFRERCEGRVSTSIKGVGGTCTGCAGGAVGCPFNLQEIPQRSLSDALILAKNGCRGLKHPKLCLEVGHPASPDRSWFIISHGNESLTRCTPVPAILTGDAGDCLLQFSKSWMARRSPGQPSPNLQALRICSPQRNAWGCAKGGCEMHVMGTDERCRVWGGPEVLCPVLRCMVAHIF